MAAHVVTERHNGLDYVVGGVEASSVKRWMGVIKGPSSYVDGGDTFASLIPELDGATIVHVQSGVNKDWYWGLLAGKLAAYVASTGVQVAAAVDMATGAHVGIPLIIYFRKD